MEFCWSCSYVLVVYVFYLENVLEEEMNRFLGIVLDVEYFFICVYKEEDVDIK